MSNEKTETLVDFSVKYVDEDGTERTKRFRLESQLQKFLRETPSATMWTRTTNDFHYLTPNLEVPVEAPNVVNVVPDAGHYVVG